MGDNEIRNRDIGPLREVLATMQLAEETERLLDWTHARLVNINSHLNGMPGGGLLPKGLEDAMEKLYSVGEAHLERMERCLEAMAAAERILNSIQDRGMLAFVMMKYVFDLPDARIRRELNMSEYGFKRARAAVESAEGMEKVCWPKGAGADGGFSSILDLT